MSEKTQDRWQAAINSEPAIFQYFLRSHAEEKLSMTISEKEWEDFVGIYQDFFTEEAGALLEELWLNYLKQKNENS